MSDASPAAIEVPAYAAILKSGNPQFGGLSGLEMGDAPNQLMAITDHGWAVLLDKRPPHPVLSLIPIGGVPQVTQWQDAEALRRASDGKLWVSFEGRHRIAIHRPGWAGLLAPPERMISMPGRLGMEGNRGLEAVATLPGGRGLALSETRPTALAILLDGKRLENQVRRYKTDLPPVDAVALANGGLLVLVRAPVWPLPPLFATRIDYVAPGWETRPVIEARPLFRIDTALPAANYEGMAVEPLGNGDLRLWLISDDNFIFLQDTVLASIDMPVSCLLAEVVCRLRPAEETASADSLH